MAPALYSSFESLFGRGSIHLLERLFDLSFEHGGCVETGITREPGVSFNPLPARICHIGAQAGALKLIEDAGSALLLPAGQLTTYRGEPILEAAQNRALGMQRFLRGELVPLSWSDECFILALALDALRHLHMTDWPHEERMRRWRELKEQAVQRIESPETKSLRSKISDAEARFLRRTQEVEGSLC